MLAPWLSLAYLASFSTALEDGHCPTEVIQEGFVANFYSYPAGSLEGLSREFYSRGFKAQGRYQGSTSGVLDVDLNVQGIPGRTGRVYGFETTPNNFAVELTGHYRAPQTGAYWFTFGQVNDGASLQIGRNNYGDCCGGVEATITDDMMISSRMKTEELLLNAGDLYPIRIVYYNANANGVLQLSVRLPDGRIHQGALQDVYQLRPCAPPPPPPVPSPPHFPVHPPPPPPQFPVHPPPPPPQFPVHPPPPPPQFPVYPPVRPTPTAPGYVTTIETSYSGSVETAITATGPYTVLEGNLLATGIATTVIVASPDTHNTISTVSAPGYVTTVESPYSGSVETTAMTTGPYTMTEGSIVATGVATTVVIDTPSTSDKSPAATAPGYVTTVETPYNGSVETTAITTGPYTTTEGSLVATGVATTVLVETPSGSGMSPAATAPGYVTTVETPYNGNVETTATTTGPYTTTEGSLVATGIATTVIIDTPSGSGMSPAATAPGYVTTVESPYSGSVEATAITTGPYTTTEGSLVATGVATTVIIDTPSGSGMSPAATAPGYVTTVETPYNGNVETTATTTGPYTTTEGSLVATGVATTVIIDTPSGSGMSPAATAPGYVTTVESPYSGSVETTAIITGPYTMTEGSLVATGVATTVIIDTPSGSGMSPAATAPGYVTTLETPYNGNVETTATNTGPYTTTEGSLVATGIATTIVVETPNTSKMIYPNSTIIAPGYITTVESPYSGSVETTATTTGPYTTTEGSLVATGVATTVLVETPSGSGMSPAATAPGYVTTVETPYNGNVETTATTTGPYTTTEGSLVATGVATTVIVETPSRSGKSPAATAPGYVTTVETPYSGSVETTATTTGPYTVTEGSVIATGVVTSIIIESPDAVGSAPANVATKSMRSPLPVDTNQLTGQVNAEPTSGYVRTSYYSGIENTATTSVLYATAQGTLVPTGVATNGIVEPSSISSTNSGAGGVIASAPADAPIETSTAVTSQTNSRSVGSSPSIESSNPEPSAYVGTVSFSSSVSSAVTQPTLPALANGARKNGLSRKGLMVLFAAVTLF